MTTSGLRQFTSESVTEGHPDKVCDRIADSILDEILAQDPAARVAVEVLATKGLIHVAGEVTTDAYAEIPEIVRTEVNAIGYDSQIAGFDGSSCGVSVSLGQQSPDIAEGVDVSLEVRSGDHGGSVDPRDSQGAGDQGLIFGFACNETPDLMPAPLWLSHRLAKRLAFVRKEGLADGLLPDGKTQVTLRYDGLTPVAFDTILVSSQHEERISQANLAEQIEALVIAPVLEESGLDLDTSNMRLMINPSGRFVLGGPAADAGVTGRKIIVDTYGGSAPHGGGAFSGKDPSKVDRSGAYAGRWVAKNVVAAGLATKCQLQVAYAIGSARPVSLTVDTFGTSSVPERAIECAIREVFDLRPAGLIEDLGLLDTSVVQYRETSAYGHFGREGFTWEETNRTAQLLDAVGA